MQPHETNVLIVDDDRGIRFTLEGIIEDEGYKVKGAEDGYQAIELARETHFHWVFMDIRMPGINGVETYLEIKKISPESKVVMMTGFSVEELVDLALEEGVFAVLHKPLPVGQIFKILKSGARSCDIRCSAWSACWAQSLSGEVSRTRASASSARARSLTLS